MGVTLAGCTPSSSLLALAARSLYLCCCPVLPCLCSCWGELVDLLIQPAGRQHAICLLVCHAGMSIQPRSCCPAPRRESFGQQHLPHCLQLSSSTGSLEERGVCCLCIYLAKLAPCRCWYQDASPKTEQLVMLAGRFTHLAWCWTSIQA